MVLDAGIRELIKKALDEDIGAGDLTTTPILTGEEIGLARAIAKADIIVAGIELFGEVFSTIDPSLNFKPYFQDGQAAGRGDILASISGSMKSILLAERVALNFFQRIAGIATMANSYVEEVNGTGVMILDTRKTTPTFRAIEKYAVRTGGGTNHRFGLYDGVMIKDNHISAAGGISNAVRKVRGAIASGIRIEVETKNLREVQEALNAKADIIMLDNMDIDQIEKAVALIGKNALVEASGNVTILNVRDIAKTGVDFISVGALTHSAPAADISLLIEEAGVKMC